MSFYSTRSCTFSLSAVSCHLKFCDSKATWLYRYCFTPYIKLLSNITPTKYLKLIQKYFIHSFLVIAQVRFRGVTTFPVVQASLVVLSNPATDWLSTAFHIFSCYYIICPICMLTHDWKHPVVSLLCSVCVNLWNVTLFVCLYSEMANMCWMRTGAGVMFPCPLCFRLIGGSDYKLIYRHYATLYFVFCVDSSESELGILDLIQVKSGKL